MKYIDIHAHLDSKDYDADRAEVLARMKEEGVGTITIGADLDSSKKAVEIAEANENVWACIGIHPECVSGFPSPSQGEGDAKRGERFLEELTKSPKVVAIGECGLDYFYSKDEENKKKQKILFKSQIEFAIKHNKPLMLHIREAYDDAVEILKNYKEARGNVHFFAGNIEIAKEFLDLGFTMSFTGVITFTRDYDEVIKYIPQNMLMSETDAPFVAPVPFRGKRNEPVYVIEVIKKLAEIRGEDFESLNSAILANAGRVFAI
jgi:TatD DNase family protein